MFLFYSKWLRKLNTKLNKYNYNQAEWISLGLCARLSRRLNAFCQNVKISLNIYFCYTQEENCSAYNCGQIRASGGNDKIKASRTTDCEGGGGWWLSAAKKGKIKSEISLTVILYIQACGYGKRKLMLKLLLITVYQSWNASHSQPLLCVINWELFWQYTNPGL